MIKKAIKKGAGSYRCFKRKPARQIKNPRG